LVQTKRASAGKRTSASITVRNNNTGTSRSFIYTPTVRAHALSTRNTHRNDRSQYQTLQGNSDRLLRKRHSLDVDA
jgi:hypothetical protein